MSDQSAENMRPGDPVGKLLYSISYGYALFGGLLMSGLALMVVVSVTGRWLFSAPIYGDFELVAMGTAVAVFSFLPFCHMCRGNVIVDLFMSWAPQRLQALCDAVAALLLMGLAATFAWRMTLGAQDLYGYGETSVILAVPIWWAYPFAIFGFALLAACCLYTALASFKEAAK